MSAAMAASAPWAKTNSALSHMAREASRMQNDPQYHEALGKRAARRGAAQAPTAAAYAMGGSGGASSVGPAFADLTHRRGAPPAPSPTVVPEFASRATVAATQPPPPHPVVAPPAATSSASTVVAAAAAAAPMAGAARYMLVFNSASRASIMTLDEVLGRREHPKSELLALVAQVVDAANTTPLDSANRAAVDDLQAMPPFRDALHKRVVLLDRARNMAFKEPATIKRHLDAEKRRVCECYWQSQRRAIAAAADVTTIESPPPPAATAAPSSVPKSHHALPAPSTAALHGAATASGEDALGGLYAGGGGGGAAGGNAGGGNAGGSGANLHRSVFGGRSQDELERIAAEEEAKMTRHANHSVPVRGNGGGGGGGGAARSGGDDGSAGVGNLDHDGVDGEGERNAFTSIDVRKQRHL